MTKDECYDGARVYWYSNEPGEVDGTMRIKGRKIAVVWDNGYIHEDYADNLHLLISLEDPFRAWVRKVRNEAGTVQTGS